MWSYVCRIQVNPTCVLSILETQRLKVGESLKSRLCPFLSLHIVTNCNFSSEISFVFCFTAICCLPPSPLLHWYRLWPKFFSPIWQNWTADQSLTSECRLHISPWRHSTGCCDSISMYKMTSTTARENRRLYIQIVMKPCIHCLIRALWRFGVIAVTYFCFWNVEPDSFS